MKNTVKGYLILGLLFVTLSVIAFALPTEKAGSFWTAYAFTALAFILQIPLWTHSIGKKIPIKNKFFGISAVYLGALYFIVQIIIFAVVLLVPTIQLWLAVIICAVPLCLSLVLFISTFAGKDEIERVEAKAQGKVNFIRQLKSEVELLIQNESDPDVKAELNRLADTIRYSDPMSNDKLHDLEAEIMSLIIELRHSGNKLQEAKRISRLLDERNSKCAILK